MRAVGPREYSQVRRIAGTLPLGLRLFSPVAARSFVVVETLGETRERLRNVNCAEDAAERLHRENSRRDAVTVADAAILQ